MSSSRFLGHCDAVRFVYCDEESSGKNKGNGDSGAGHLITCAADKTTRIWSISNIKEDNAIGKSWVFTLPTPFWNTHPQSF